MQPAANAAAPAALAMSTKTWLGHPLRYGTDEDDAVWFVLNDFSMVLETENSLV